MEKILNQILNELKDIKENQNSIQSDVSEIKSKLNSVYDQTADLTEFRTLISTKLTTVSNDIKFVKHKVQETEEDVFTIQNHLSIIK